MYSFLLLFILIFVTISILFYKKRTVESLDNITDKVIINPNNIVTSSPNLPVSPDFSSNFHLYNYADGVFVEPQRYDELQEDVKENTSGSVQPYDNYFDIMDLNCAQSYDRPWNCLIVKGNYVNNIPRRFCKKVCPEKFKRQTVRVRGEPKEDKNIESFRNFTEKPVPSHYWCYNGCKKTCEKHPYDPLDPSKNTCGQNGFSQVPLQVFLSKESCLSGILPCERLSKEECLNNSQCGWCTNGAGQGTCFRGTTEGPLNLIVQCTPDRVKPTNSYRKGHANPFEGVQQSWNIPSFSPLTI